MDELLQKAQATKTNTMGKPAGPKPATNESGLVIKTITSGNGTTITATGGTSTSIPTAGKISVVPTNLLMKQPTAASVASSMATPIQIYTQPTMSLGKGVASAVPGTMGASTANRLNVCKCCYIFVLKRVKPIKSEYFCIKMKVNKH